MHVADMEHIAGHKEFAQRHLSQWCSGHTGQIGRSELADESLVAFIRSLHRCSKRFHWGMLPLGDPIAISKNDGHFRFRSQKEGAMDRHPLPCAHKMGEHVTRSPSSSIWTVIQHWLELFQDRCQSYPCLIYHS